MSIFDIIGPVMVGPSSSHTAGAAKIGLAARRLLGETPVEAKLLLHGSFAATGLGHGTDRALVAGILGLQPDDIRLPISYQLAAEAGLAVHKQSIRLIGAHPNSVRLELLGAAGNRLALEAASLGGGRIRITNIDGLSVRFQAEYPTLIVQHTDQPGQLAQLVELLAQDKINVANLYLTRAGRGQLAIVVAECDCELSERKLDKIRALPGLHKMIYLSLDEGGN